MGAGYVVLVEHIRQKLLQMRNYLFYIQHFKNLDLPNFMRLNKNLTTLSKDIPKIVTDIGDV